MSSSYVPVVIPALDPCDELENLVRELAAQGIPEIVVIDDGSRQECKHIFEQCRLLGATVLTHEMNLGKGRALKDGFHFLLEHREDAVGCVTADADGQHAVADVLAVAHQVATHRQCDLVLGTRKLAGSAAPVKSRLGNNSINLCLRVLCGLRVSDSQTGLRGVSRRLMERSLDLPGDRFEFEMQMLLACADGMIDEVPITTIYEPAGRHTTHFSPLRDSLLVLKALLAWRLSQ